jgi:hypothetical protein
MLDAEATSTQKASISVSYLPRTTQNHAKPCKNQHSLRRAPNQRYAESPVSPIEISCPEVPVMVLHSPERMSCQRKTLRSEEETIFWALLFVIRNWFIEVKFRLNPP